MINLKCCLAMLNTRSSLSSIVKKRLRYFLNISTINTVILNGRFLDILLKIIPNCRFGDSVYEKSSHRDRNLVAASSLVKIVFFYICQYFILHNKVDHFQRSLCWKRISRDAGKRDSNRIQY